MKKRVRAWLEQRYPVGEIQTFLRHQAGKLLPPHASWGHTLGSLLLFLTINQVVTGILLMVYYRPTPEASFESVRFITTKVNFGWLIRGLHAWGADAMILLLVAHMFRTFVMGTFKKPRELTWVVGVFIFGAVLVFGFTGYLLPWNQLSYWATTVGTEIAGVIPLVGGAIKELLRGGHAVGAETLGRFYVVHVAVLPWVLTFLVAFHIFLVRYHGLAALAPVGQDQLDERTGVRFFPHHVARESIVFVVFLAALVAIIFISPPEIGEKANPLKTPEGIKPEWYFLPTYQLLKFLPKTLGIFVSIVPFFVLLLWPFVDRTPARDPWKRPWSVGIGVASLVVVLFFGALGHLSERTFLVSGTRVQFDIDGMPHLVGEKLSPEKRPAIALAVATEERKKMIVATVTQGSRPVERVKLEFVARGESGVVSIGQDETLDDGTAAVRFPEEMRGDARGELEVKATIKAPEALSGYEAVASLPGAAARPHEMWTRACPEAAAIIGGILLAGLFTAIAFHRLARHIEASALLVERMGANSSISAEPNAITPPTR